MKIDLPKKLVHSVKKRSAYTVIDWNLGNTCNFSCSYCPSHLHDGSISWPTEEVLIPFANKLLDHYDELGRKTFFQFTGGEPTLCPSLLPLSKLIKKRGGKVSLISNGTRGLNWWKESVALWFTVTLTFHIEYTKKTKFENLLSLLTHHLQVHINVTMLPNRFDECFDFAKKIYSKYKNVSITLKPLLIDFKSELYPYESEQLYVLHNYNFHFNQNIEEEKIRGKMKLIYYSGDHIIEGGSRLLALGKSKWKGWECWAGLELLVIHGNGNIFRGNCKEGGSVGNLYLGEIKFPSETIVCGKNICSCLADIATTKKILN